MDKNNLKNLLKDVKLGDIGVDKALEILKHLPYEDLSFAHIDHHRSLRQGFPEVIYGEGKTTEQIIGIAKGILNKGNKILITKASEKDYRAIRKIEKGALYHKNSRAIVVNKGKDKKTGKVLVITAGTSDIPVAEEAAVTADFLGSSVETIYDIGVAGIHRLFDKKEKLLSARVIVVVAGMDGALASVVGGLVDKPVVAVPTSVGYGASFGGLSALLAMLNSCANGIAVVNIDNGFGAGCLAHRINMMGE
ncbi:MAG: nickel pincer cofactor biosynthesis protein LarB [Nitrospirota bacterium]|jgi:NCAIR mutase (PurE)-related protein